MQGVVHSAVDWLDRRTGVRGLVRDHLTGYELSERGLSWLTLGGLLLFILALQIASGVLLLFQFVPDPGQAFASVRHIQREVPFGWFVQTMHGHGGNLMVAAVFIHMARVAYLGAYKDGREVNWITGCLLLTLTLGASLTGYILPWNQVSYWATTVVTSSMESVPLVGAELVRWIRGADVVGPATFRRAFAAHVSLIPLSMIALAGVHLYLLRFHGSSPPPVKKGAASPPERKRPFFPDFVVQDALLVVAFLIVLVGLVVFAPNLFSSPQSFEAADPFNTPPGVKPEWYFLWSYQLLRMFPEWLALLLQMLGFGLLLAVPFLDRSPHRHPADRPWVMAALAAAVVTLVALTVAGSMA